MKKKNSHSVTKLRTKTKLFVSKWILPPGFSSLVTEARKTHVFSGAPQEEAPNALDVFLTEQWSLLVEALETAKSYLEFGCGLSTEFVSSAYSCRVRSVETSAFWAELVQGRVRSGTEVIHIDLGPVGDYGIPLSYANRNHFVRYFEAGFEEGFDPDVILIDGRFRVACFLTCLMRASPGTKIVFDDYMRPYYKVVEEFVKPLAMNQRQAMFVKPESIDVDQVRVLRDQFTYVME
jgi:hypothetical protein